MSIVAFQTLDAIRLSITCLSIVSKDLLIAPSPPLAQYTFFHQLHRCLVRGFTDLHYGITSASLTLVFPTYDVWKPSNFPVEFDFAEAASGLWGEEIQIRDRLFMAVMDRVADVWRR